MCTAVTYQTKNHYFGRNLDYDIVYGENITITPRQYPLRFRHMPQINSHYAIIGVAYVTNDPNGLQYPLYYDGINEKGLGMAGLNFPGNAVFHPIAENRDNIAQFELIPWILGQCSNVEEVKTLIPKMNFVNTPFSPELPSLPNFIGLFPTPTHASLLKQPLVVFISTIILLAYLLITLLLMNSSLISITTVIYLPPSLQILLRQI